MVIKVGDAILFIGADTKGLTSGIAGAMSQVKKLGTSITSGMADASRKMGVALTAVGAATTLALGKAVKAAAEYEQAITNAAVVTGEVGNKLDEAKEKLDALASTLGQTTVFTAREAADALGILARKGFDVVNASIADMQPFLDLASATMSDLAFTTDIAASTLRAFGFGASEIQRVTDIFVKGANTSALSMQTLGEAIKFVGPIASAAGVSLEETVALLGQLANKGTVASIAGTGLRRSMVTLLNPSGKFAEVLKRIGLSAEDVSLKLKDIDKETKQFRSSFKGGSDSGSRFAEVLETLKRAGFTTADAMEAFGDRGGVIIEQLAELDKEGKKSIDTIKEFRKSLRESGVASRTAKEQLKTLRGQWTLLKSAVEAVVIGIGKTLLPILTTFATKAAKVTQGIARWVKANSELVGSIAKWVGALGLVALAMGPLLIALPAIIDALFVMGTTGAPAVLAVGLAFKEIAGIIQKAIEDPAQFFDDVMAMANTVVEFVIEKFNEWFDTVVFWLKVVDFQLKRLFVAIEIEALKFLIFMNKTWNEHKDITETAIAGIIFLWKKAWPVIQGVASVAWEVMKKEGAKFADELWKTFVFVFDHHMDRLIANFKKVLVQIKNDFANFFGFGGSQFFGGGGGSIPATPVSPFSGLGAGNPSAPSLDTSPSHDSAPDQNLSAFFRSSLGGQSSGSGGGNMKVEVNINGSNIQSAEEMGQTVKNIILQAREDNEFSFGANN